MRRFYLQRDEDVSGVSGEGIVADGVEFSPGGVVVMRWRGKVASTVVFDQGMAALEAIHGHEGRTRAVWVDAESTDIRSLARGRRIIIVARNARQAVQWTRDNELRPTEVRYAATADSIAGFTPDTAVVVRCGEWWKRSDLLQIASSIQAARLEYLA